MATSYEELIAAKKEAIGLQLEAEYRSRLQTAYNEVQSKLGMGMIQICIKLI